MTEDDGAEEALSPAVRVASAVGLFLGGGAAAVVALLLLAYVLEAIGIDGSVGLWIDFGLVSLGAGAAAVSRRWRLFGIGGLVGVLFAFALVSFYLVVLQAGEDF